MFRQYLAQLDSKDYLVLVFGYEFYYKVKTEDLENN